MPQGGGGRTGDLPLRPVLVVGADELRVLLADLPRVLTRRPEQDLLQVAEQVLAASRVTCPSATPACR